MYDTEFYAPGHVMAAGHRLAVLSNGALKFSRVTLGDAGTYQCLAKNDAGVTVAKTKLVLQGNADFWFPMSQNTQIKDGYSSFLKQFQAFRSD